MIAKELFTPDFLFPPFFKMAAWNFQSGILFFANVKAWLFKLYFAWPRLRYEHLIYLGLLSILGPWSFGLFIISPIVLLGCRSLFRYIFQSTIRRGSRLFAYTLFNPLSDLKFLACLYVPKLIYRSGRYRLENETFFLQDNYTTVTIKQNHISIEHDVNIRIYSEVKQKTVRSKTTEHNCCTKVNLKLN